MTESCQMEVLSTISAWSLLRRGISAYIKGILTQLDQHLD